MKEVSVNEVFVHPAGQDDNLGDSALRVGLLNAFRGADARLHICLDGQSSDYLAGVPLERGDILYPSRTDWLEAIRAAPRPIYVVNAGEINPQPGRTYPHPKRSAEMRDVVRLGGVVIAAGLGAKDPIAASRVSFDPCMRDAAVMSWRDQGSRDAAGFGDVSPDWAFTLGNMPSDWAPHDARRSLAVTLRFDRPWPDSRWFDAVRTIAVATDSEIVTVAQVARDAPRAVHLAEALNGSYLVAPSTRHDDLDVHVRSVYARSLAVVSDRAHALIMGATEGAFPMGSATDPQKIRRLLDAAGLGALTGSHGDLIDRATKLSAALPSLAAKVVGARRELAALTGRIRSVVDAT